MVLMLTIRVLAFMTMMIVIMISMRILYDTDDDTDDDTIDDADDDADDGGRGNRRLVPGGAVHFSPPPVAPRGRGCVQISRIWIPSGIRLTREWVISPPLLAGPGL